VPQVKRRVVNHVQDAPPHRDSLASCFSRAIQIGWAECREHLSRFYSNGFQAADKISGISDSDVKFSIAVSRVRAAPDHLGDPEMFCARNVRRQDRQRVGRVIISAFHRTPVEGLSGQVGDQRANLSTQVLDPLQIVVQFGQHLALQTSEVLKTSEVYGYPSLNATNRPHMDSVSIAFCR
jgi:hypothetical protein